MKLLEGSLDDIKRAWRVLTEDEQYDKLFDKLKGYTVRFKRKPKPRLK